MKVAPIYVPWERRLQTLAALSWILALVVGGICGWFVFIFLFILFPVLRIPLLIYLAYIYYDREAGILGKRRSSWFRKSPWWKHLNNFFPVTLVKTTDLPANKNYLLATFPHGVLCFGPFCAFGSDHSGFDSLFPGLRAHIMVLASHFQTPFARELALTLGSRPSSAEGIRYILSSEEKGQAVSLMVGGAKESMHSQPGQYKVYLKERKGFVRLALQTGASLVPVISFGEPELYDLVKTGENTLLWKAQNLIKKVTGVAPLIFNGRGIFQYSYGIVPRRHPLNVVVGTPIDVVKNEDPSNEIIDALHKEFVAGLEQLFNAEKAKYLDDATQLIIL